LEGEEEGGRTGTENSLKVEGEKKQGREKR